MGRGGWTGSSPRVAAAQPGCATSRWGRASRPPTTAEIGGKAPVSAQPATDIRLLNDRIQQESAFIDALFAQAGQVIVGQKQIIERPLSGLITGGAGLLARGAGPGTRPPAETAAADPSAHIEALR